MLKKITKFIKDWFTIRPIALDAKYGCLECDMCFETFEDFQAHMSREHEVEVY